MAVHRLKGKASGTQERTGAKRSFAESSLPSFLSRKRGMFYYRPFPGPITLESDMKSHSSAPPLGDSFCFAGSAGAGTAVCP